MSQARLLAKTIRISDDIYVLEHAVRREERMRPRYGFLRDLALSEPRLICSHFS